METKISREEQFKKDLKTKATADGEKQDEQMFDAMAKRRIFVCTGRIFDEFDLFNYYFTENMNFMISINPDTGNPWGQDLGIDATNMAQIPIMQAQWFNTSPTTPGIYQRKTTRKWQGPQTNDDWHTFRDDFNDYYHPLLDIVAASPLCTDNIRKITNIVKPPTTHHIDLSQIPGKPIVILVKSGQGWIEVKCKTDSAKKRASKPKGSDEVEVRYAAVGKALTAPEITPKWKLTAPDSVDGCFYREYHSKATFKLDIGTLYSGCLLYCYCRYSNSKHREIEGIASDWSLVFVFKIP